MRAISLVLRIKEVSSGVRDESRNSSFYAKRGRRTGAQEGRAFLKLRLEQQTPARLPKNQRFSLRRRTPASPTSPEPNSRMLLGSGVVPPPLPPPMVKASEGIVPRVFS